MEIEEFRAQGHRVVDWIADYLSTIEDRPVLSQFEPGAIRTQLPAEPPLKPEPFEDVLADLDRVILPGITHWQHPSFFAYFPANASGPAILGELLSAGLGVQGMLWATSPACTELEQVTLDWMAGMLGLPERFYGNGVIQDTASTGVLVALLAALHRASGGATVRDGVSGERFTVYASTEVHSSIDKAVRIAGLGSAALRAIPVDPVTRAMSVGALREHIVADVKAGFRPAMIVATVGTTSTTAIDPVSEIGVIARENDVWLHVDAAYAGVAAICPELRWILDGVGDFADSFGTNPHKWMLTNFDCHTFWVADRTDLLGALSILPEFLRNKATDSGQVVDYRDWHIQLGRRFRALKLWAVIRCYGISGLQQHIRTHVGLAQEFASWLAADERFEVTAPHPLSLVCFRLHTDDAGNMALMHSVNASGQLYLTHTKIDGRVSLRLAIGGTYTTREHVERAWNAIRTAAS
jgi:aromatic-L-amino-acid/L-tryptophan decarboxylase